MTEEAAGQKGVCSNKDGNSWRGTTEQDLLGVLAAEHADGSSTAGKLSSDAAAKAPSAAVVPLTLVDLIKPGPSGTVASTAAAAAANHAATIKAASQLGPGGLAVTMSAAQTGAGTAMQDLLRAAQKALASGLGDWHLQVLQDISPLFQEHVLMGALGPETLKHKHRLPEQQILQLYGLVHRHCTGFQQEVQAALAGAAHTEQLLASIWTAFAQLWDECVQVTFQGEVLAAMQELQGTYAALLETQDALAATQQENAALKERCNQFVKANLDHMLAWRSLKTKADALEGEVTMLSSANSEISLRAAATQARNTQLTVRLDGMGARLAGVEQQIKEREAALAAARIALIEKDSGLCRLEAQAAALEQQLLAAGQAAKKQDIFQGDLQRQLEATRQLVRDGERQVADKQRAYNLLHADFAKQKAEAAEMGELAAGLEQQLAVLQQQLADSQGLVAKAEGWRKRWEICQMEVEDLQAANIRATMRRQELVSSYWPVMERLNSAEDVVAALTQQLHALGQDPAAALAARDAKSVDVTSLTVSPTAAADNSSTRSLDSSSQPPVQQQPAVAQRHRHQHQQAHNSTNPSSTETTMSLSEQEATAPAAGAQSEGQAASASSVEALLKEELQQLQDSYLLLQEEYWRQKERLMALELEAGQLRVSSEQAQAAAVQATGTLARAEQDAAKLAHQCSKLEADIVGYKSWVRELEKTEQAYLKAIREQGALEDGATVAQRQLSDCRMALASAEANWHAAQAAAEAMTKERKQLMGQLAQEINKSTLFEQELQLVHKQEISSSRAAQARLNAQLDQQAAELAAARSQLEDAQQRYSTAAKDVAKLQGELQHTHQQNRQMAQQLQQAHTFFMQMLQKLEVLESRVSYINSTSISSLDGCSDSSCATSKTVEVAVEAAVHLMERLLVTLQCLAADAATISNTATAAKVEVLVKQLVEGLEAEAAKAQPASIAAVGAPRRQGAPSGNTLLPAVKASALTVLRNAAGVSSKQRVQELEQQVSVLQLRLSDSRAQLSEALSSGARLQRSLQLKTRAVASFEQQLAAARAQLQQLQASQAGQDQTVVQMQQALAEAKLDLAQAAAAATAHAGELRAAVSRAAAAEKEWQEQHTGAEEAAAACQQAVEQLAAAVAAARQQALDSAKAAGAAAAAQQQVEVLRVQLVVAQARAAALEADVVECRHKADISIQAARDADYRAVQLNTLLADARREIFTKRTLQAAHSCQLGIEVAGVETEHSAADGNTASVPPPVASSTCD